MGKQAQLMMYKIIIIVSLIIMCISLITICGNINNKGMVVWFSIISAIALYGIGVGTFKMVIAKKINGFGMTGGYYNGEERVNIGYNKDVQSIIDNACKKHTK